MNFNRYSGILLNPTSLPGDFGIGDLGNSAYKFIDFLEKSQMGIWQILPLGPTSFGDSPYQSFSSFAGNPLIISPEKLIAEGLLTDDIHENIPDFDPNKIDYGNVILYKRSLFKQAFKNFDEENQDFKDFCEKNSYWLDNYSLFVAIKNYFIEIRCAAGFDEEFKAFEKRTKDILSEKLQKDYYFGAVWVTWPDEIKKRKASGLKKWSEKLVEEIKYYKFLQFEFFKQWFELKKYTNAKGIKIVGDIPIFVAYDSADVWSAPKNYYLDSDGFPTVVAGVPPDYFSEKGQLWGNPLYNWQNVKKGGYSWWSERIKSVLNLVDIVRIDHFRGFEAFWQVPFGDADATRGEWVKGPGKALFDSLKKSLGDLPIIAEDLGVITEEVKSIRDNAGFPGMRVLHFAFDESDNNNYLPHNYIQNTVVYTGTHDNDTTLGWYKNTTELERDKFRRYMNVSGQEPHWDLIRLAMASAAKYAVFPLQDVMGLDSDARMNTPSTSSGNWQWRYRDDMLKPEFAERLEYLSKLFARGTFDKSMENTEETQSETTLENIEEAQEETALENIEEAQEETALENIEEAQVETALENTEETQSETTLENIEE